MRAQREMEMQGARPDYLTLEQVGARLQVSEWTVRRLIQTGQLTALRVGRTVRIPVASVERLTEQVIAAQEAGMGR